MVAGDLESSDLEHSDSEMLDDSWSRIRSLPALPARHIWTMRREAVVGCSLVCLLVSLLVGLTQGVALAPDTAAPRPLFWTALALIYAEAAIAGLCLLGLMFGNPGEVKRSPQSCFPIPELVADRLSQGEPLDGLANPSSNGRSYCVRCLVWRPDELHAHHCSTCNRCVRHFDHHCGVFGRCIAGDGFGGNMGYFKTIITMAGAGCVSGRLPNSRALPAARPRPSPLKPRSLDGRLLPLER